MEPGKNGRGGREGGAPRKKPPAGRLLYDEIVLMPVKGSDAASDDSSRRPCFLIFYQRKIKFAVDNNI